MENMFSEYQDIITIPELQKMLHIGRNSAYDLVKTRKIKSISVGKKIIIPKCCVIDYLINELNK